MNEPAPTSFRKRLAGVVVAAALLVVPVAATDSTASLDGLFAQQGTTMISTP